MRRHSSSVVRWIFALSVMLAGCSRDELAPIGPNLSRIPSDSLAPMYGMDNPLRIPGEYIVRFNSNLGSPEELTNALTLAYGGQVVKVFKGLKGFWGRLPTQALEGIRRNPSVKYIEANIRIFPATTQQTIVTPGDNWGLDRIDQVDNPLNGTYNYDYDGTGVHIWIIDTGVDSTASELLGRIDYNNVSTYNGTNPFTPCFNHGTPVAILAAGSIHGVAKGATINVARVSDDCQNGSSSSGAVSASLEWIADISPRPAIANYSFSSNCSAPFSCIFTTDDAVNYAISHGVQVVVAGGNDGNNACNYSPARVTNALTVGASTSSDSRVVNAYEGWSSNYGSCLDLFAPGIYLATGSGTFSGTSGATPLVTGVGALYLQQQPTSAPASVRQYILDNAAIGTLSSVGTGSPNKLLHSRPAVAAPSLVSLSTSPSPAKQYTPFTLTINGSGFDPATVEVLIGPSGCGSDYDTCNSVLENASITSKSATQLIIQNIVFGSTGTKDVYVRNGRNGYASGPLQFSVSPMY